ncbi:MAG: Trm112 family protein [Neisseriaceae bacterium]|jgi:uncharacterized protein YbaR (Trm112 family)|nr:MAG: Trm112 family protein [Neisseriaceae bacterium]
MNSKLLEILVCPLCKAPVEHKSQELICNKCKLAYPIDDGIPVMLIDEARKIDE